MKRLYVSDVDHTLLDEKKPEFSSKFKNILKQLTAKGDHFVLCSGRPTQNLIDLATKLKTDGIELKYVAGYNGVEIYDLECQEVIAYNGFDLTEVTEVCSYLDQNNLDYMIYDQDCLRTNIPDHHMSVRESEFTGTPLAGVDKYCASPKVLVVVDPDENSKYLEMIKNDLPQYEVFNSMMYFVEIVKKGVNKSTALKEIANLEAIDHANTFGFGDSGNDIELIRYAGTGVAVNNGIDEVKQVADAIIGPVWEDSVADFLELIYKEQ